MGAVERVDLLQQHKGSGQDAEVGPIDSMSYMGTESIKEQDAASRTFFL